MSKPQEVLQAGGKASSSKGPAFHLIPTEALVALADRFELGVQRKEDKAWNAVSSNQEVLKDKAFLIERCAHVIHHAMKLRDQLLRGVQDGEESMKDNASAISWAGAFFTCAANALQDEQSTHDAQPELPEGERVLGIDAKVVLGNNYQCVNGILTGRLHYADQSGNYYVGRLPEVIWDCYGKARKVWQDLTDEQLRSYNIRSSMLR